MITCRELTELITDYLEDRLGLWERVHLGLCRHCRAYLRQMRGTIEALGRLPLPEAGPPPEVEAELLRRFRGWKQR